MKTNNKGYMLVELIVSVVIAFVVVFFLMNTTVKMVNKNNDYYIENKLLADKNIITKEIMDDINYYGLDSVRITTPDSSNKSVEFTFNKEFSDHNKTKKLEISENKIKYGNLEKNYDININTNDVVLINEDRKFLINIPVYTNYDSNNYGIELVIPYNNKTIINYPTSLKKVTRELIANDNLEKTFEINLGEKISLIKSVTIESDGMAKVIGYNIDGYDNRILHIRLKNSNRTKPGSVTKYAGITVKNKEKTCSGELVNGKCYDVNANSEKRNGFTKFICERGKWGVDYSRLYTNDKCNLKDNLSNNGIRGDLCSKYVGCKYEQAIPTGSCYGGASRQINYSVSCYNIINFNENCSTGYTEYNNKCYKCAEGYSAIENYSRCKKEENTTKYIYNVVIEYK